MSDSPSAKAAQQIQRYDFDAEDLLSGCCLIRKPSIRGAYVLHSEHEKALSDSLRPYREALKDITDILGTGACKANSCEGCDYEMKEAARVAREALALIKEAGK